MHNFRPAFFKWLVYTEVGTITGLSTTVQSTKDIGNSASLDVENVEIMTHCSLDRTSTDDRKEGVNQDI